MNIHPIFVHFPIALLFTYSILELFTCVSAALRRQLWTTQVKAFLLFVGVLATLPSLITGGMAEDLIRSSNPHAFIIKVHEPFALLSTLLYVILAAAYLVRIFDTHGWANRIVGQNRFLQGLWSIKKHSAYFILDNRILPLSILVGLSCLTILGALGAAIVYGPNIDPLVSFVYHLFFAQ